MEHPKSQPAEEGRKVVLTCRASGCPTPSYQWFRDGAELPHGVDEVLTLDPVKMSDRGKYCCIVSNKMNTEKSNVVELQVLPGQGIGMFYN